MSDILTASGLAGDCCSQSKKNFKKQYSMVNNLTIWSFGFDLIQQWMLGILWCIWNTYTTSKKDIYRKRNINNMMKISFIIFLSKFYHGLFKFSKEIYFLWLLEMTSPIRLNPRGLDTVNE